MTPSLSIIVPTYQRIASRRRLAVSVARYAPQATLVLVIQDEDAGPPGCVRLEMPPGFPGTRRHAGARLVQSDLLLFLDDDHELLEAFAQDWPQLAACAVGTAISLPLRAGLSPAPDIVAMAGGLLVDRDTYHRSGGFGEDYLDDLEFTCRLRWAGVPVQRWLRPVTRHHGGTAGGLRALPGVAPRRDAHRRLSRLDERYPGRLRRASTWWGFRFVKER
jgi:hypothetical protein